MLVGIALPVIGGLSFLAWRSWAGYPPITEITRQHSGLILVNPVRGLVSAILQWDRVHDLQTTLDLFSALFFVSIVVIMIVFPRWRRVEWIVYIVINLLVFLSKESFQASSLQSMARYVLVLFPAYIILGDWLGSRNRLTRLLYTTISSAVLLVLSALYTVWFFIG
jgi:hypothetical protein